MLDSIPRRCDPFCLPSCPTGDGIRHTVKDNVERASVRVAAKTDNVAGVKIPKFAQQVDSSTQSKMELTGLGKGGAQVQECRKSFLASLELLIQLASLQTSFLTLDAAIKTTNRRVNALENVVIPKLENTVTYIKVCPTHGIHADISLVYES